MREPVAYLRRYERLVRKMPSLIIVMMAGFGLTVGMPWAVGTRGTVEILPPSTSLTLWTGESTSYTVDVHNGLGSQATLTLNVRVTQTPPGGNPLDLQLSYPRTVTMGPGNAMITVHLQVQDEAVPGNYILSQWIVVQ